MKSKTLNNSESTPAHVLLAPVDNNKVLDFVNFNSVGSNLVTGSNAFKKIQSASKSNPHDLYSNTTDYSLKYDKINNLYLTDVVSQDSLFYGIKRQHEYASTSSVLNNNNTHLDNTSVSKLLDYNFNLTTDQYNPTTQSVVEFGNSNNTTHTATSTTNTGLDQTVNNGLLTSGVVTNSTSQNMLDSSVLYRTFDAKSANQQVLASDRNVRNLENFNPQNKNYNFSVNSQMVEQASSTFPLTHTPTSSTGSVLPSLSYDRFTEKGMNAPIMSAKEELAPNFVFTPF